MTNITPFATGPGRPRSRRGLGLLVGATICVTPLALAPAALAGPIDGVPELATAVVTSLPHTAANPLGEAVPGAQPNTGCDLISPFVSCLLGPLDNLLHPGATATSHKAKSKRARKARAHRAHR